MSLGPTAGCVLRLWPDELVTLGLVIGEGLETVLAAATRIEHRGTLLQPAWAVGDAGHLAKFPVLAGIEALTILVDHDEAGQRAARECRERWLAAGREVTALIPNGLGQDFNDIVQKDPVS
jgi:putative DNA primase/helicase